MAKQPRASLNARSPSRPISSGDRGDTPDNTRQIARPYSQLKVDAGYGMGMLIGILGSSLGLMLDEVFGVAERCARR